ncbi:MAG: TonB-dependent receptor [Xanthomonadales bacterium]|nr:TonB-dependent receptor [Xanthomonadales bacterium]
MPPLHPLAAAVIAALLVLPVSAAEVPLDDAAELDRTVVVGSREKALETAGSAQYVGADELAAFEHADAQRVLRQVPGVYLIDEEGYGLRPNIGIRGSGTDRNSRITVMEDGVLIAPAAYAAPAAYYFPTMQRMSAVEVRKGSASIRSGPRTTGGVVNFVSTGIPDRPLAGKAQVLFGQDSTLQGHGWAGGTLDNGLGWLVETVQQATDGYKRLDGGGDTGYDLQDWRVRLGWTSTDPSALRQRIELKLGRTDQASDETYLGLTDADFRADPQRRYAASALDNITTEHEQIELRHGIVLTDSVDLSTTAYRHEFSRAWYKLQDVTGGSLSAILANPAQFQTQFGWLTGQDSPDNALRLRNNNRSYEQEGLQSVLGWSFGGEVSHLLEVGVRWHRDFEDRFQQDDRYRMRDGRLELTQAGAPGSQENRKVSAKALALYVQDEIRFGDFILTPGVRHERIDLERLDWALNDPGRAGGTIRVIRDQVNQTIPGVGLTWLASPSWSLFASVHKGFNPPAPGSTAASEESVNTEIGARFERGSLFAELIGFHNDYDNLVGTCTASTGGNCNIGDQFDGGKARVQGVEARMELTGNAGGAVEVPFQANYTWTEASFRSSFNSGFGEWGTVIRGDELPYLPEHMFHAATGLRGERWSAFLGVAYVDAMRTTAGQGPVAAANATDSAWVWDLSASWQVARGLELFSRIENLTDREYIVSRRPSGARPGLPRTALVGLRYSF